HHGISSGLVVKGDKRIEGRAFLIRTSGRRRTAAAECRADFGRYCRRQIDVDAHQAGRHLTRHGFGDGGAPVATLGAVTRVSEALHELTPCSRDMVGVPARTRWLSGEAVAGHGRDHDVERILRPSTVRGRIRQRVDHTYKLDDRAWPAMCDDNRQSIRTVRLNLNELDVYAIDLGREHGKRIQSR